MFRAVPTLALAWVIVSLSPVATAASEEDAADAVRREDFGAAAAVYEQLVHDYPTSVPLRLELADALKRNRQFERAVSEYKHVLKLQPDNVDAVLGIGTVRRWQGNIGEATSAYKHAHALDPQNADAMLGLAATYALDHDFASTDQVYEQAVQKWPQNSGVQQAAYDFRRQRNPKLYLFWESDLSFATRQAGVAVPFAAKEEIGAEAQEATSYAPELGHAEVYSRSDRKLLYTHYFGLNHLIEASARSSEYHFNVPTPTLGYSSIDTYKEYRVGYTAPYSQEQVFSVRYTMRPTILKTSQNSFTAHKLELELNSRWLPTFSTQLGGGLLRDLDSNATTASQLTDRSLVKVGFQWDATNRLSLGGKYITNPDLDNSMNATSIAEAGYSINETWTVLGRYRVDQYKTGPNQIGDYLAARYVPNSHWWSEIGLKHSRRGSASGDYGLVSLSYRF